ncbi:hypothetical protein AB0907_38615 [Streptomyces sp. NPDC006975]|uniref:hypothetical protein n=1 Tax=Streptomyces sp. NPDC006975 TaxID=3154310 RepID=UPI00345201BD
MTGIQAYTDLFCKRSNGGCYQAVARYDVVPTRGGQTVWIGPGGWTRNRPVRAHR